MSKLHKNQNDIAWEKLFSKYNILHCINVEGEYKISAEQIKEFREPRLMAKFDNTVALPEIFSNNGLAILPVTRGDYIISHFDAYHRFEDNNAPIIKVSLPAYIQSLDYNDIPSEAIALNCAMATDIIKEFLQDEDIIATVSGRMSSGIFDFNIINSKSKTPCVVHVNNSQMEIDAAYEGVNCLSIFEAKRGLPEDFLIRQLYYPFRSWKNRITKPVRPIFLVYFNSIFRLYEYTFEDINNYNSLVLVNNKNYSIEDTTIEITDIQAVLKYTKTIQEPRMPFPQADNFERVINICELLNEQEITRDDVTEQYAFHARQTNYYTDAARYLGLLERKKDGKTTVYRLSEIGKNIQKLNFKERQ
jgi:hypothetical protein